MVPIERLLIRNPKRASSSAYARSGWYPYYAGYSAEFTRDLIVSAGLPRDAKVLDPWNGAGTTTTVAAHLGHSAVGFDLNPAMIIVAKARLLCSREKNSLSPLAAELVASATEEYTDSSSEPLCAWFVPRAAATIRALEVQIQKLLVDHERYLPVVTRNDLEQISDLAAFYYTALFRATRRLMGKFAGSNPTWIRKPKDHRTRLRPSREAILTAFSESVESLVRAIERDEYLGWEMDEIVTLRAAASQRMPLSDLAVDFVLTSPPYCTRIDYAVATIPELCILGYQHRTSFDTLRRNLIGTSTVPKQVGEPKDAWGRTCNAFLKRVAGHTSRASATYYYKNHVQYYAAMFDSIQELSRVLRSGGTCIMVVQDSYYKEIRNDLPAIVAEMGEYSGLRLRRREDFVYANSRAQVNPKTRRYRTGFLQTESVLCLQKG